MVQNKVGERFMVYIFFGRVSRRVSMSLGVWAVFLALTASGSAFMVPTWQAARDAPSRRDQHTRDVDVRQLKNLLLKGKLFHSLSATWGCICDGATFIAFQATMVGITVSI